MVLAGFLLFIAAVPTFAFAAVQTAYNPPSGCPFFSVNSFFLASCQKSGGFVAYSKDASGCDEYPRCYLHRSTVAGPEIRPIIVGEPNVQQADAVETTQRRLSAKGGWAIILDRFFSNPSPIAEGTAATGSGVFRTTFPLTQIRCDGPSYCGCTIFEKHGELQPFECDFSAPVNGTYSFIAYDELGNSNAGFPRSAVLVPGHAAQIVVSTAVPLYALVSVIVIALTASIFACFKVFDLLFAGYKRAAFLKTRVSALEDEFRLLKYRYMKRELDEISFKRAWAANEAEYTSLKRALGAAQGNWQPLE
jgi:hypothetical protein